MSAVNQGALQQSSLGPSEPVKRPFAVPASTTSRKQGLFSTAIIQEDARSRGRRAAQTGFALAIQIAIVGGLLLIPLFFTEGIDLYKVNSAILIAPPPPAAPPPPMARAQAVAPKPTFIKAQLTAPTVIPKKIAENVADAAAMAPTVSSGMAGGVPGGMGDVLGGIGSVAPPPPPPAAERPKGPIRITSGMKEPALLYAPPMVYSPIARLSHVEGTVVVEAIIDEQGNVTQVHLVSGPALLVPGAMKAVAERRYAPTILDGQAVAIRLTVKVDYHLS
ncbi:MAG TPA: energy transducer TonB [Candidatus Acidoferrales bacterium]|jgi:protein TonB|nr:energy transducer TonB [Candidatus Acidoferrales bacterium]